MAITILTIYTDFNMLVMGQNIKLLYITVLFWIIHGQICYSQYDILCRHEVSYTKLGNRFESNVNILLNDLVQYNSQGFNMSEYGEIPDQVYGLLQCRGDTTVETCYSCSQQASTTLSQICENATGGLIWLDDCFLRYENYSFFGQVETVYGYYIYSLLTVSFPGEFNAALESMLYNLSVEAISGSKLYASGITIDSFFRNIYGMVQCTGDMSAYNCSACLSYTINQILTVYGGRKGARALMGSCIVYYEETNVSYASPPLLSPPAEAPNTDSPNFNTTPSSNITQSIRPHPIICDNTYFLKGSDIESNLRTVLNDLLQQTVSLPTLLTSSVIYTSEYGNSTDTMFGFLYCSIATLCYQCARNVTTTITETCKTAAGGSISSDHCSLRYQNYNFFGTEPPPATTVDKIPPKLNTPPNTAVDKIPSKLNTPPPNTVEKIPPKLNTPSKKIPLILGVVGGLLLVLIVCLFGTWRRLESAIFQSGYEEEDAPISNDRQIIFRKETLLAATENFCDNNKLGEGGFGPVYKGTTHDGKEIAVKRLSVYSNQGKKEFLNEVELVSKIQHRNLVKLLGCCTEGSETLLVYEYLLNKSLDKILFDPNKRKHLDWQKRYIIILGIARGILYLHQDSQPRIIHRDIKASNILLDDNLNPKIADFGLAKHFPDDASHLSTKVAGTYGYMAPEYAMHGKLSVKADVYSFGILLLEIITGRKNADYNLPHEMEILLGWAWRSYKGGNIVQMIDPSIIETCNEGQVLRCIQVGLLCTQADSSLRPPMSTVTLMLSTDSLALPDPTKPVVLTSTTHEITMANSSGSGSSHVVAITKSASFLNPMVAPPSNVNASITDLVPR